jgi:AraC-like DNA-binding protein
MAPIESFPKPPDLEVIFPRPGHSFRWHCHDYPDALARWNYHPEYELHYIVESHGTMFVGDYISEFKPGNLVLLGPNIPHQWVSDIATDKDEKIVGRDVVLQFDPETLGVGLTGAPREIGELSPLLEQARMGLIFSGAGVRPAAKMLTEIGERKGLSALTLIYELLLHLAHNTEKSQLVSPTYAPILDQQSTLWVQNVIEKTIGELDTDLKMSDVAHHVNMSESAFSKLFKRVIGLTFTEYLRKLRIGRACNLLSETDQKISTIASDCGFRNLSNFNRYFLHEMKMTPKTYRQAATKRIHMS